MGTIGIVFWFLGSSIFYLLLFTSGAIVVISRECRDLQSFSGSGVKA